MQQNGQIINQALNYLNQNQNLNNGASIQSITEALNRNMALLDEIQSELSVLNNVNQDNLIKREEYIKLQNEELLAQLRNLQNIQSNIENKNRYIEQINQNINYQQNNIYLLVISIILGVILFSIVILYGIGKLTNKMLLYGILILFVIYIIIVIYFYNIFYVKSALQSLFGNNPERRFGEALKNWSTEIKNKSQEELYGLEQSWINSNCNCPPQEETQQTQNNNNNNIPPEEEQNYNANIQQGYFYYDGSTPQQLLMPSPKISNLENIQWVDYSQPVGREYNFNLKDPQDRLKYEVSNSNTLIPNNNIYSVTNTVNL